MTYDVRPRAPPPNRIAREDTKHKNPAELAFD